MKSPKTLPVLFFTIFLDLLGVGILIPVIPVLLANPRSSEYLLPAGYTLSQGFIMLGWLLAIYPLMQFIAAPILGQLSDRFGRKKVLAFALAGTCASYVLFAIAILLKNIPLLFISRGFDGITGGNISIAQAAIADLSTPENRAKNFGLIGAAFGLGFILGPYIGGKLSDPSYVSWFNAATPFWFAAGLSFVNILWMLYALPETYTQRIATNSIKLTRSVANIVKAFSVAQLRGLFTAAFLYTAGFSFFTAFFSVFLIKKFNWTQGNVGDFFAYIGIWIAFTQGFVVRRVVKYYNEQKILSVSIIITAIALLLFFVPESSWGLLLLTPIFAIANGLTMANMTALVSRSGSAHVQGEILGINSSVQALAQSIPPILSGYIAASLAPSAPLAVSAIVIALAWVAFLALVRGKHQVLA